MLPPPPQHMLTTQNTLINMKEVTSLNEVSTKV